MRSLIPVPVPVRRDPAPSRLRYRLTRLWLRPWVRRGLTLVLPLALAAGLIADQARRPDTQAAVLGLVAELRAAVTDRPEFLLTRLDLAGGSQAVRAQVAEAAGVAFPVSTLAIDLDAVRRRIEALSAVAAATVSASAGGTLSVSIVERVPAALLRRDGALWLIDREGHRVAQLAERAARPDLPVLAGTGAETAVPEALALIAAAGPLAGRLRGLVRVGERRWDLVLDRDQRILLPAEGAAAALARVLELDRLEGLLARDVTRIDLRSPARPVLRLGPEALRLRGTGTEGQET